MKITNGRSRFYIITLSVCYFITITTSSVFYYKIIDPEIWRSPNLFSTLAINILLYYFLYNLSFVISNFCSSLSQALYFSRIEKNNLLRATLERDIKSVGELHNIILNYYVTLSLLLITCYRLYNISVFLVVVYFGVIAFFISALKILQRKIKALDKNRKCVIDRFIQTAKLSHLSCAYIIRSYENKLVWKLQFYMTVSRVVYNLAPLVALITALMLTYIDILTLSLTQIASLVIVSTVLIDIADGTSYLIFYSSQITNGMERAKNFSLQKNKETYSHFKYLRRDMLRCFIKTRLNFKSYWLQQYRIYFMYGQTSRKTLFLLVLSFILLTGYSFLKFKFDTFVVKGASLQALIGLITFSLFSLMSADLLLKRLFYVNAKNTIFTLLNKLSRRSVNNKDIEVLSYDTKILDDGISFSLTEFFFALSTSMIFIYAYLKMEANIYILLFVITMFMLGQYAYRKIAIFTKQMEVYFVTRSGTLFSADVSNHNNYAVQVYFSSLSSQLANTINNRSFMIYCSLLISSVIYSLSFFPLTTHFSVVVATVSLLFKLSHSLSYAIRYLSQLEGWSISVARTTSRIY